ncbi:MAG TPA: ferritin-like domain-containing protein, partial [Thermosynechococcaceae cyanobacterium]
SQPVLHQHGHEIQQYGTLRDLPIALSSNARSESCTLVNQILADTIILYHLYKKHHWLMRGHTFYQLHLLLDKHASEQIELVVHLCKGQRKKPDSGSLTWQDL